jgi:hypothetical protein
MFSLLERNILIAKGLDENQLAHLERSGIDSKRSFATVGDAATLMELVGLPSDKAAAVMSWALGVSISASTSAAIEPTKLIVESADAVYCVNCRAKQPNDYSSGDLCGACGRQAEPTRSCFWCGGNGPGKFCRGCGTQYVPTGELELAAQLKRDGLPKDDIHPRLAAMSTAEKDALWGRVRWR